MPGSYSGATLPPTGASACFAFLAASSAGVSLRLILVAQLDAAWVTLERLAGSEWFEPRPCLNNHGLPRLLHPASAAPSSSLDPSKQRLTESEEAATGYGLISSCVSVPVEAGPCLPAAAVLPSWVWQMLADVHGTAMEKIADGPRAQARGLAQIDILCQSLPSI